MAERIIDTSMLTAEANALRNKGIIGSVEFKSNGFADAINAIPSGDEYQWDLLTAIIVTCETGSTVTCVKGSTTLTVEEISGTWTFIIPEAGTWTVNASKGSSSKSATVNVVMGNAYSVTITYVPALNDTSWEDISAASAAGLASSYWSVGDRKQIILNGSIGNLSLSNFTTYAQIIGFNHNSAKEGNNLTHFQLANNSLSGTGVDLCFVDSEYDNSVTTPGYFSMNSIDSNSEGWAKSQMRTNICGTSTSSTNCFISAMPSALRSVLKPVTKYTDNVGSGTTSSSAVMATTDYCFLLAEYEVFGTRTHANSYEQNSQERYTYYSNHSAKRYKHNATTTAAFWWLRSPVSGVSDGFCGVNTVGGANSNLASYSRGVAPGFCV